jgi:O-antigen/teichoic acid export membrane protein
LLARIKHLANSALAHQGFMRYFANTTWMFGEQVLRMLAGLFVGIWVARYLGPNQFGVFSYSLAFVSMFTCLAKLGLDSVLVRNLVNEPQKRDVYLGTAFWLKLAGALLMLIIIALTLLLMGNDSTTNLYIIIIASGIIFQSFEVIDFYFQSKVLSKFVSLCKITQLVISSIIKIYLVMTSADLFWFVFVSLIDQITLALTFYVAYRCQKNGNFYNKFDLCLANKILKECWPLLISGFTISIAMRLDQVIIGKIVGLKDVGMYSVAVKLSEVFIVIGTVVSQSYFPRLISLSSRKFEKEFILITRYMFYFLFIGAFVIALFSSVVVKLTFGEKFTDSSILLSVLIFSIPLTYISIVSSNYLIKYGFHKEILIRQLVGLAINILINLALIKKYGALGAAIATVITDIFIAFVFDIGRTKFRHLLDMKLTALLLINYSKKQ